MIKHYTAIVYIICIIKPSDTLRHVRETSSNM